MPDPIPADLPEPIAFRRVMGRFATGVAVIAVLRGNSGIAAMTINSLVSVSLDPMLISWSLQNSSRRFGEFAGAERFAISILAARQDALARRYAARGDGALIAEDFAFTPGGLPVIADALGHLECQRWAVHPAGDHTLILGEVTALASSTGEPPLVFFGGQFGALASEF